MAKKFVTASNNGKILTLQEEALGSLRVKDQVYDGATSVDLTNTIDSMIEEKQGTNLATYPTALQSGSGVNIWDATSNSAVAVNVADAPVESKKTILMTDESGNVQVNKLTANLIGTSGSGEIATDAAYDVIYEPEVIAVESDTGKGTMSGGLLAELELLPLKYIVYNGKRYVCQSDTSEAGNWLFVNMGVADGSGVVSVLTLNSTSGAWEVAEVPFGNGGGGGDAMLTASSPEEMEALLTEENVGKVVKYTGEQDNSTSYGNHTDGYPTYSIIERIGG